MNLREFKQIINAYPEYDDMEILIAVPVGPEKSAWCPLHSKGIATITPDFLESPEPIVVLSGSAFLRPLSLPEENQKN